jgi:hypothetical protein
MNRPIRQHKRTIPESYFILRILSTFLVFAVLYINFINVWSLNISFLLILLVIYIVFIFYPRKTTKNTIVDILKFGFGVVFLFVGLSLFVFVAKSTVVHDFPFNVGLIISIYALFWIVVGWVLVVKSHYTNISSRFIRK